MTAARLFMVAIAFVAIYLILGLASHIGYIESIKITRLGLFFCTLMVLSAGFTFWVEWQEEKERRAEEKPPAQ